MHHISGKHSHAAAKELLTQAAGMKKQTANHLKKNEQAAIAAMKNVYFLAKNHLSNSLLPELNKLCKSQGVDVLSRLEVDNHTSYTHTSSIQEFQKAICGVIEKDLLVKISDSQYYSILIDESTDMAVNQNMLIYIRIVTNGVPETHFLCVKRIHEAKAETLCTTVIAALEEKDINLNKLVGIATDGAATMIGRKSGVVVRLRDKVPHLLATHCIAHRLALAAAQAADNIPYLVKFQEILNTVYKYFEYSPKNMSRLERIQKVLSDASDSDSNKGKRFKQVFGTRWLSFEGSLEAVLANYSSLLSVLASDTSAKSQGLLKSVSSYKFLYVASFMADAMSQISALSRIFQKKDIDCSVVNDHIVGCIGTLKGLLDIPGPHFSHFKETLPLPCDDMPTETPMEYEGHIVKFLKSVKLKLKIAVADLFKQ